MVISMERPFLTKAKFPFVGSGAMSQNLNHDFISNCLYWPSRLGKIEVREACRFRQPSTP